MPASVDRERLAALLARETAESAARNPAPRPPTSVPSTSSAGCR
ncbi:hypothetical protein ACFQZC_12810 [Streptacidiphilus monticola]